MNNTASMKSGYIAIITVLVVSAIVVSVGTTIALSSINALNQTLASYRARMTLDLAESCVEDILLKINKDNSLPTSPLSVPPLGSCTITGSVSDFTVTASRDNHSKSIKVTATRSGTISVTGWKET